MFWKSFGLPILRYGFCAIKSKMLSNMKNPLIVMIALLLGLSSCEKTKNTSTAIPDGTYFGTFQRTGPGADGQIANVSLTFHSGVWFGESDLANYPALCRGTYEVEGNKLIIKDDCLWTAQFDWSFILNGEYSIEMDSDSLIFSKSPTGVAINSFVDTYKMSLPVVGLKESPLEGVWVESVWKKDTMEFVSEYDGQFPVFTLKRESQIIDGLNLPGYFSGPYHYKLLENSISTQWFLSSNSSYFRYYFNMAKGGNEFKIGNFFADSNETNDTLTFMKIK